MPAFPHCQQRPRTESIICENHEEKPPLAIITSRGIRGLFSLGLFRSRTGHVSNSVLTEHACLTYRASNERT